MQELSVTAIISAVLISLFTLYGITEFFGELWRKAMLPKNAPPKMAVVFLKSGMAKQQIDEALTTLRWHGVKKICKIIAIDSGITDEEKLNILSTYKNNRYVIIDGEKNKILF